MTETNVEINHFGMAPSLTEIHELECEDDDDGRFEEDNPNMEVEYYERVLRNLFGRETADRFVHPKIDESVGVAGMSASLKSGKIMGVPDRRRYKQDSQLSLSKIQTNAERLWHILRENSINHIQKEDNKLAPALRNSFNAFARGFIDRNMTPPQRSFIEDEELIEMRKKMKNHKLANIDIFNRKKHLMFDLSELQEGNQAILLRDKSFLITGETSVKELLFPPIVEDETILASSKNNNLGLQRVDSLEDDRIKETLFHNKPNEVINLKFFNENDSLKILKERNLFRDKINKKIGQNDNVMEQMIDKSRRWIKDDEKTFQDGRQKEFENIKPISKDSVSGTKKGNNLPKSWQPLTLGAVMDFKVTRKPTFIFDDDDAQFRQGACRLWRPKLALV